MNQATAGPTPVSLTPDHPYTRPQSLTRMAVRRFLRHKGAILGLIVLAAVILYILIGSLIFTEAYSNFTDTSIRLSPPSAEHPFGTDRIGRDIMARTVYGGQISLTIGALAVVVEIVVGAAVGAIAGFYGGWLDSLLMRFTEAMLSIPSLLLLLVMARFFGSKIPDIHLLGRTYSGSVIVIIVIIGLTSWMTLARIVRSNMLSLKETEFVLAAQAVGATNLRIIVGHILPNTLTSIIVAGTLGMASAILAEAYISFLGLGVQEPSASWGNILTESQEFQILTKAPWYWFFPSALILLTVLSINFLGDGLRDALDPRSQKG